MGMGEEVRCRIARRAAQEVVDGMVVNLGIGIPTLVPNYIPTDVHVLIHAENGILGSGPTPAQGKEDPYLCNAGGYPISLVEGGSYCDSAVAFAMIRTGRIDMTILGALEVSERGDLANWIVPGRRVPGIGGAMELAQKAKQVVVLMNHLNHAGESKLKPQCTLPLTAPECVDLIITDMAVFRVGSQGLILCEIMAPYTVEQVLYYTDARVCLAEHIITIP
ncbi:3-oxoacid CoA-transferase subunit B [Paenibacillus sp. ACRRX]|uniref:3-oxoacid CoA-transferase subunit B n=1 Tax=unclassified Paenibacillus TaxID=185978 RepID=UPI001EF70ACF|nr:MULTISPECIES: 3-oxoacid CoA-transferase subunit B [unclassified Paenibacillus]MCG7406840.1 3-oxoacid CoA-transferase subunit B [Paenibacillus sp. ACRRX]MDK8179773.1 3-oxoacid CoA-transferase subunit B [Paenibacillus sp. UMB4589-SE434]